MTFARPLVLLLLLALPFWWWLRRQRLRRAGGTRLSDVGPVAGASGRLWPARLPLILRSLGVAAWVIAAALEITPTDVGDA